MTLTGYKTLIGNSKPDLVDTSNPTIVYEGYQSGADFIICKTDLSTTVISRTYAVGSWSDRLTLQYN